MVAECFNRGRDYGAGYFRLLDGGWHVGALGSSDHHGEQWGHAQLPRTGLLAPALTQANLEAALCARHTFAVNRPAVRLVLTGNEALMGARLTLRADEDLRLAAWLDEADAAVATARTRLELWTNAGRMVAVSEAAETQGKWHHFIAPPSDADERWFVVRAVRDDRPFAYSSPIWARWLVRPHPAGSVVRGTPVSSGRFVVSALPAGCGRTKRRALDDGQERVAMLAFHSSPLAALGWGKAGGMNVYVRELARALGRRGVAVDIFTRAQRADEATIVELSANARVITLPAGPNAPCANEQLLECVGEYVARIERFAGAQQLRYAVIHSHYWLSGAAALALRQAWRVPVVQMFHTLGRMKNQVAHDAATYEPAARLDVEEQLLRGADAIVAATPLDCEQLRLYDYGAHAAARTTVIPCGIDTELFRPHDQTSARRALKLPAPPAKLLLFVGRIEPVKGLDVLLRALRLVGGKQSAERGATPDLKLLVVGGAPADAPAESLTAEEQSLRQLARELGVAEQVCFLGAQPQARLPLFYSAADAVVVPSRYESFGLVALEAQACGAPVIASRVGGLTYTVRDGVSGYLTPPDDAAVLAARITRLLSDEKLRAQMGAQGRLIAQAYTWARVAEAVLALYQNSAGGAAPARLRTAAYYD